MTSLPLIGSRTRIRFPSHGSKKSLTFSRVLDDRIAGHYLPGWKYNGGGGNSRRFFFQFFCYAITLHMIFLFLFLTELRATRISCPCPHLFTTSCLHSPPIPINCACAIIRKYIVVLKNSTNAQQKPEAKSTIAFCTVVQRIKEKFGISRVL